MTLHQSEQICSVRYNSITSNEGIPEGLSGNFFFITNPQHYLGQNLAGAILLHQRLKNLH